MKLTPVLPLAALVLLCACQDRASQRTLTGPDEAPAAAAPARSTGEASDASTVCESYAGQLGTLRTELAERPDDSAVAEQVAAYEAIISDACDG